MGLLLFSLRPNVVVRAAKKVRDASQRHHTEAPMENCMIKSANQHPVHTLLGHDGNLQYRVPPYQRAYAWQKGQWEHLFQDLLEADGSHFLGTIITLNQTDDAATSNVLEVVDGQQRLTTLTILLAAIYSLLHENIDRLDEDERTDLTNLGRQLVRRQDGRPRVTPQVQEDNHADYLAVLAEAGLKIEGPKKAYFPQRRIARAFRFFQDSIRRLAEDEANNVARAAQQMLEAVQQAVIVKIEVASHADAFVLFESLNNRGAPLTPVDLIKNHLLAESERKKVMKVEEAFKRWNGMLTNLGDDYATHERFLRHYYNAFKGELPVVPNAPVATKSRLIRIYERVLADEISHQVDSLVAASKIYGRVTGTLEGDSPNALDRELRQLTRAQGAPSYVLLLWMLTKVEPLGLEEPDLIEVTRRLTSFFVRRNLTGFPQTYALPKLFMDIISKLEDAAGRGAVSLILDELLAASASDETFRERLAGPVYEENTDVTRFVLATLAEDAQTKESTIDLWAREKGHFVWTIEHIFPQGEKIPPSWQEMLGGSEAAKAAREQHVHRLGNLTITAYNSNLGNKSFAEKRDRMDSKGRHIGFRNGLSLNKEIVTKDAWAVEDIERRTSGLVDKIVDRFPLSPS